MSLSVPSARCSATAMCALPLHRQILPEVDGALWPVLSSGLPCVGVARRLVDANGSDSRPEPSLRALDLVRQQWKCLPAVDQSGRDELWQQAYNVTALLRCLSPLH
jgi:hypothetical protein